MNARLLSGHLDDVDLDEVLKVIALSRRSGVLEVVSKDKKSELQFVTGRLVRVQQDDSIDTVARLLLRASVLFPEDLLGAPPGEPLEDVVARAAVKRAEPQLLVRVDDILAEHIEATMVRLLLVQSGSFSFQASNTDTMPRRFVADIGFTLPSGVDVEELSRLARQRRAPMRADASNLPSMAASMVPQPSVPDVVVVDPDRAAAAVLQAELSRNQGLSTVSFAGMRAFIDALPPWMSATTPPLFVVRLCQPRADGRGLLGGLEAVRLLHKARLSARLVVVFDDDNDDAWAVVKSGEATALRLGRGEDAWSDLTLLLSSLRRPQNGDSSQGFDLAAALRGEIEGGSDEWLLTKQGNLDDDSKNLQALKAFLTELNDPSFEEEIPLLVLRFAAAFFVRGALFTIDHRSAEIVGVGGFGVDDPDPGRLVRRIRLPLLSDTVFTKAISERRGVRQPFWESASNLHLVTMLGGPRPREVYAAPLRSPKGLEALLYADNGGDSRPSDIALLEIFLQQAAAAIERSMLAREVKRLSEPPSPASLG